ncbi:hypothetical protein BDV93DRAFT_608220 [Ceratobasidium sp. AG-I]|nr:hypothetical protein BDV93DRAFT_608220 [Ceratobasidium sp. AG-I]
MLARIGHSSFATLRAALLRTAVLAATPPVQHRFISSTSLRMAALNYYDEVMVDHNNIRDLHQRFLNAHKSKDETLMTNIANTIVREAAVHSDGEELSIYKVLDQHGLNDAAENDRAAHQTLKQAFSHVDSSSIKSLGVDEYAKAVDTACNLLFQHAAEEENVHYKQLSAKLTDAEKSNLAVDFLKARMMAPSRPHPSAPQSGGVAQKLMGGMAKPHDAIVSSMRTFVELKHQHADYRSA